MNSIFEAMKEVAFEIDKAINTDDLGYSEGENASGEEQLKLDVHSDMIIERAFGTVHAVRSIVSEEKDSELELHPTGSYTVCYDPLDGSSLVDVNLAVGTIFGVYAGPLEASSLIASAYIVYGPRIELVFAMKNTKPMLYRAVNGKFKAIGEISMNEKGKLNAPGGTQQNWAPYHKAFIDSLFQEGYRLRYSGGMVPDLHQIMLKGGGLFSYPATTDKPKGKLRQLFEVIPFAFMFEQAGGQAVNDKGERLMELIPSHPHDTSPCFFGSNYEIEALKKAYGVN
jgi:fructose-1,6-bisphosphatase I